MSDYTTLFGQLEQSRAERIVRDSEYYTRKGFSNEQSAVITAPLSRHVAVLAGPGSGKTRVLVQRVIHLLDSGVPPSAILVCTFTRNASEEMKTRLAGLLTASQIPKHIGTMHSLSYKMGVKNMPSQFLSMEESMEIIENLVKTHDMTELSDRTPADLYMELSRAREECFVKEWLNDLYERYQAVLAEYHAQDFLVLLEKVAMVGSAKKFRYILVDEAQDLTHLQQEWLKAVSTDDSRFFMVGDDDQSIYSFRGYQGGALNDLMKNPATEIRLLTNNFRSSVAVVTYANNLISHNWKRWPKTSVIRSSEQGFVDSLEFEDEGAELVYVVNELSDLPDLCVLGRTRKLLEPFAEAGLKTMTLHESKGKEFEYVWLTGCEEKLMPHVLEDDIEEERRLFYVGITRAKAGTWLAHCKQRHQKQKPSRFLDEIREYMPRESVSVETTDW